MAQHRASAVHTDSPLRRALLGEAIPSAPAPAGPVASMTVDQRTQVRLIAAVIAGVLALLLIGVIVSATGSSSSHTTTVSTGTSDPLTASMNGSSYGFTVHAVGPIAAATDCENAASSNTSGPDAEAAYASSCEGSVTY